MMKSQWILEWSCPVRNGSCSLGQHRNTHPRSCLFSLCWPTCEQSAWPSPHEGSVCSAVAETAATVASGSSLADGRWRLMARWSRGANEEDHLADDGGDPLQRHTNNSLALFTRRLDWISRLSPHSQKKRIRICTHLRLLDGPHHGGAAHLECCHWQHMRVTALTPRIHHHRLFTLRHTCWARGKMGYLIMQQQEVQHYCLF